MINDDLITNVLIITIVNHYFEFIKIIDKKENSELLKSFKVPIPLPGTSTSRFLRVRYSTSIVDDRTTRLPTHRTRL